MSENLGGFVEVVSPSFFSRSQSDGWPNVISLYSHRSDFLLGAVHSGTLRLEIDKRRGLDYEVDLPRSRDDILEAVQRQDCAFSSFSFVCFDDQWSDWHGQPLRTLVSGKLLEVGPTPRAAYTQTSAAMRSLAAQFSAPIEDVLGYAEKGDLRPFFTRSDMKLPETDAKFRSGRRAVVEKLKPTVRQRQLELMSMVSPGDRPLTPQQQAVEALRHTTIRQKVIEVYGMDPDWS